MTAAQDGSIVEMPRPQITERVVAGVPGVPALAACVVAVLIGVGVLARGGAPPRALGIVLVVLVVATARGLTAVAPGEAQVLQLFGHYGGTVRTSGLRWVNPFARRRKLSTRIRNHETPIAKVNDADGNPIEIAAVVVWQVEDTARATYEVDDLVPFVSIQAETAIRHVATSYPYDARGGQQLSLRENAKEITSELAAEISARVAPAGVRVIESRVTRLAYAPEVAHAMLRRQQADAVVAARQRMVEGAVGMVEMALARLDDLDLVELDAERKAAMVSNLLVVLCSDQAMQPVVNAGSLYQ